jgi:indolepyruvate ferredoxin oxidoreductase alpha subunit
MLGNEALARGLLENGCAMATSYPGTPASEILGSLAQMASEAAGLLHLQWAVNEKIAFEIAYAGAISGLRTAVSMKQVGLNVASDPLMSAAYMGARGGFVVISADDPGPHSSQTEQDSRLLAMLAKVPVLDPATPAQAKEMVGLAFALSEDYRIPVMLRPTTRVCHARQDVAVAAIAPGERRAVFKKDPARWAATPKFRFRLHAELEQKLAQIAADTRTAPLCLNPDAPPGRGIIASGAACAHAEEILDELGLWDGIRLYRVLQPYPLHTGLIEEIGRSSADILVLEETTGVIEMQLADRRRIKGKLNGAVPAVGELLPERIEALIRSFAGIPAVAQVTMATGGRRPTLCAGCPHRASFFAIKKAAPKGIYTSDIGCYTLGLNLGAVDTVLCMGAAISQAAGFYQAHKNEAKPPPIIASIGDSTFFHAGLPALVDAVVQNVHFVLVILDNRTTAMTGNQPTAATGVGARGESLQAVDIENLVRGCGVAFVRTADPYELPDFTALLKEAVAYSRSTGPAVVIARHPCLLGAKPAFSGQQPVAVEITQECDGCGYCIQHFECPALVMQNEDEETSHVMVDAGLCSGCGVCVHVCPKKAISVRA